MLNDLTVLYAMEDVQPSIEESNAGIHKHKEAIAGPSMSKPAAKVEIVEDHNCQVTPNVLNDRFTTDIIAVVAWRV